MADSSMHNTGAESFGVGTTQSPELERAAQALREAAPTSRAEPFGEGQPQSPESRRLFVRAAEALFTAAPRLLRVQCRAIRFLRLYAVAGNVLGRCDGCGAWPGEQHDAEASSCAPGLFGGDVTPREFGAVQEIVQVFDAIASAGEKVLAFDAATLERAIQQLTQAAERPLDGEVSHA